MGTFSMSTVSTQSRLLTPDEVLDFVDGKYFELVDGQLVEKKMGSLSQYVAAQVVQILGNHCRTTGVAHIFVESGYVCFPSKSNQMRRPDVSCVLVTRLPFDKIGDGFLKIRPDIAVEVISPNDKVVELEEKLDDYRDAGIPLVWLLYPNSKRVRIIRLDGPPTERGPDEELTGESILPGFRCLVSDLFVQSRA
jgi:Uma2 family endonuclease